MKWETARTDSLLATALAQAAVTVIVLIAGWGLPSSEPGETVKGFFVALWVGGALLFRQTAHAESERGVL